MKNYILEFLLWINHWQSLELAVSNQLDKDNIFNPIALQVLGVTLIMGGVYLPNDNAYMQIQLVCYSSLTMRKLFVVGGVTMILTGAMTAFWYRRQLEIIYIIHIMLIVVSIIFTISMTISTATNCDSKKVIKRVEKCGSTPNMMIIHFSCCSNM